MYAIRIVLLSPHPPSVTGSLAYTPTLSRPLGKRKACYKRAVEKLGHAPSRIGPSLRKEARRRSGSLWRKLTCTECGHGHRESKRNGRTISSILLVAA